MKRLKKKNHGFSLTEVLLAVGILSVGMTFIAGVFPVAIHLTTVATERTIAAAAADEAFAKVMTFGKDYPVPGGGIDLNRTETRHLEDFQDVLAFGVNIDPNEFSYPSDSNNISQKQYFWSAMLRRLGPKSVQITVFVSRKVSPYLTYPDPEGGTPVHRPMPIEVNVSPTSRENELEIDQGEEQYINDGYTIVDDETGCIYRVMERYKQPNHRIILLDKNWQSNRTPHKVLVVPPPVNGGRYPCIAVYQKTMTF